MKVLKNVATGTSTVGELLQLLWARKLWWMVPMVVALLLLGSLLLVGQATGVAPFIYTLF
jgi:hypothetical protein